MHIQEKECVSSSFYEMESSKRELFYKIKDHDTKTVLPLKKKDKN
jgi:hypothetical protein